LKDNSSIPLGGLIGGAGTSIYNFTAAPSYPDILKRHFGGNGLGEAGKQMTGPKYMPDITKTEVWQNYQQEMTRYYGHDQGMKSFLASQQEPLNLAAKARENGIKASSNRAKGAAGEGFMDALYKNSRSKQPWQSVASKTGAGGTTGLQGIDGLYIRRSPSGRILEMMVAESKTGASPLGKTQNGEQMSMAWIKNKLDRLKMQAEIDLNNARKSGNTEKIGTAQARLNEVTEICEHWNNGGKTRYSLHKISFQTVDGKPSLVMETHKIDHNGVPDNQVKVSPRKITLKIDMSNPAKLTTVQRSVVNGYFEGLKNDLVKLKIPEKVANRVANELKAEMPRLQAKGMSLDDAFYRRLVDKLSKSPEVTPLALEKAIAKLAANNPGRLATVFSTGKATGIGALAGGLIAGGLEFWNTGRVSLSSGKQAALGGGIALGSVGLEKLITSAGEKLAKTKLLDRVNARLGEKLLSPSMLGKVGGGVVIVVTSIGFAGWEYANRNLSGWQATRTAAEGIAVGSVSTVASIWVGAKLGARIGTTAGPLGTAVGTVAGVIVVTGYYLVKGVIMADSELAKRLEQLDIDDLQQARRREKIDAQTRQNRKDASEKLLAQAWDYLAASKIRY
jgi:hypothetical protein